mgnify:FL=1
MPQSGRFGRVGAGGMASGCWKHANGSDTFLPISLGMSLIESETREHYAEIRNEVMRRKR